MYSILGVYLRITIIILLTKFQKKKCLLSYKVLTIVEKKVFYTLKYIQ